MSTALLLRLFHVATAMLFVAGLVGRSASFRRAAETHEIETVASLLHLSEWFERTLVIPTYFGILFTGVLTAWVADWPLLSALNTGAPKWALVSLVLFLSPMLFIATYLAPRRKQRIRALADGLSQNKVTPELAMALHDKGVLLFRRLEFGVTGLVTILMVAKPF